MESGEVATNKKSKPGLSAAEKAALLEEADQAASRPWGEATFKSAAPKEGEKPRYPFAEFIIPSGRAIIREPELDEEGKQVRDHNGVPQSIRHEGHLEDQHIFVPIRGSMNASHLLFLINEKGYDFVGFGNLPDTSAFRELLRETSALKGAAARTERLHKQLQAAMPEQAKEEKHVTRLKR